MQRERDYLFPSRLFSHFNIKLRHIGKVSKMYHKLMTFGTDFRVRNISFLTVTILTTTTMR